MKKLSLSKVLLVSVLSVLLTANMVSVVFAADDFSGWGEDPTASTSTGTSATDSTTSTTDGTTTGTATTGTATTGTTSTTGTDATGTTTTGTTSTTSTDTTTSSIDGTRSATTTLDTDDEEKDENNVNSLAYTGIEDSNVLPVVIVIGAIVAGYSFRKIREYNNV